jgi:signal transduction histidine kinase
MEERKEFLNFTNPYLTDISVLVTSKGTPIAKSYDELNKMLKRMQAVTIKGTSYEKLLFDLQDQLNSEFEITYIESDQNVLNKISEVQNGFGFIDLPIYLMLIKNGGDLTRQNLFTVRGTGYGLISSKKSNFNEIFNEFLSKPETKKIVAEIVSKYFGAELYDFIDNLYQQEQLGTSILTKEKELQLALINNANLKLEQEKSLKNALIVGFALTTLFLVIIFILFQNNQKNTRLLLKQNEQIESQKEDIRKKNEQLLNRNTQLISLNEEKNYLMSILAHDLRSPLNQIIGYSDLIERNNIIKNEEDQEIVGYIKDSTERMNSMITKILSKNSENSNGVMVIKEPVDVNDLIDDLSSRYRPTAAKKSIDMEIIKCKNNKNIHTDHLLLFLALENLISNAVKFSEKNTKVTIEAQCSTDNIMFIISDQGPGFTQEDQLEIYQSFKTLSAKPTGNETSTGMGLSIVKKYISELGGKINLDSEVGKGSVFTVILPC